jgi:hypothetical protein
MPPKHDAPHGMHRGSRVSMRGRMFQRLKH